MKTQTIQVPAQLPVTRFWKKLAIIILLAVGASARAVTQPSISVAVYDFTDPDRNPAGYGAKVTALVTADLTGETSLAMVERADLKKSLGEQAIGVSGLVSSDAAAKIGQLTGAKVLVSGQIIKASATRLVIVAHIVGTETGRLFAVKVDGAAENLLDLTADLTRKIAQKIRDQAADLLVETKSHEEYLEHIVKSVPGTNRPTVSMNIHYMRGPKFPSAPANTELGLILQQAGFTVVDANSERKSDVEITGVIDLGAGPKRGDLFVCRAIVEAKVQERRSGTILAFDRQSGLGVDISRATADWTAQTRAVDGLAERIVPLLAK